MGLKLLKRSIVDGDFDFGRGFDRGFDGGFDGGFDRGFDCCFDRGFDGFDGGVEFADEPPISNIGFDSTFLFLPNKRGI